MKRLIITLAVLCATFVAAVPLRTFKLTTFTTNTTFIASPIRQHLGFEVVLNAGTGSIAFTCRVHKNASFLPLTYANGTTAVPACAGPTGCLIQNVAQCESYQLTMTSCAACNWDVYALDED